jgi:hypothetical protein
MSTLWYLPQDRRDAADCIENTATVISFIAESIAFSNEKEYHLSEISSAGLCNILRLIEGVLEDCNEKLLKEVHHG